MRRLVLITSAALLTLFIPASYAVDSPPSLDTSSVVVPTTVIAGDRFEISFRAIDDIGLDSIGPVVSYRSLEYPNLFVFFYNCKLTSGDRRDGYWKCVIPTETTNPVGIYKLIVVLTDTVGQHSAVEPITGWQDAAHFSIRQLTPAEKAAAEKAAADKAAADAAAKAAADKAAADKAAADKAAADKAAADKAACQQGVTDVAAIQGQILTAISQHPNFAIKFNSLLGNVIFRSNCPDITSIQQMKTSLAALIASVTFEERAQTTKPKTIICIKGKLTKKVNGINPKCPAGYKQK